MTSLRPLRYLLPGLAALCLGLAAPCAWAQQPVALAFSDIAPVSVAATTLEVRNVDASSHSYPNVTDRAPVPYDQAIRAWAAQRFTMTGGSVNALRVTLHQGSIVEKLLPTTKGISGWFKKEQNAEYTATLEVEVSIVDPNGGVLTTVAGKSWAAETIREDATTTDRASTWLRLVTKTFDNLDADIIPRMRQTMAQYVK